MESIRFDATPPAARRGKAVAAIVSTDDLALLEALEERGDVEDARAALRKGGFIPLEKVKARLGL